MKAILRLADHWASPTRTAVGHERHFCGVGGELHYLNSYSMTSSARRSSETGTVVPSVFYAGDFFRKLITRACPSGSSSAGASGTAALLRRKEATQIRRFAPRAAVRSAISTIETRRCPRVGGPASHLCACSLRRRLYCDRQGISSLNSRLPMMTMRQSAP